MRSRGSRLRVLPLSAFSTRAPAIDAAETPPIRVLVADAFVAEAADGEEAVALARRLRPDVCLTDIRMPKLDGLAAARLPAGPDVADPLRVVVVTTFDLDEYVYGTLRGGGCGFLLKDSGPTLLAEAVRAAANGGSLVSPSVTVRLLKHLTTPERSTPVQPSPALTDRELDVVRFVAVGRTNAEIAAELFVSLSTVKTHLSCAQLKPDARNRVETAAWAWQSGTRNLTDAARRGGCPVRRFHRRQLLAATRVSDGTTSRPGPPVCGRSGR